MVTITPNQDVLTLINVFTVAPANQQRLLDCLIEADQIMKTLPGYVSASLHRSLDGTKVTNYARWKNIEALQAMLQSPLAQSHLEELRQIAEKVEPGRYEVVYCAEAEVTEVEAKL